MEVQNFEFHFFFFGGGGGGQNKYVLGYDDIMNIFLDLLGSHSIHFRALLKVKVQYWKMCLELLNFKLFWVCLIFLILFGEMSRCWVQTYVFRKNESIPNGVGHSYHLSY